MANDWKALRDVKVGALFEDEKGRHFVRLHSPFDSFNVVSMDDGRVSAFGFNEGYRLVRECVVASSDRFRELEAENAFMARLLHDKGEEGASAWEERGRAKGLDDAAAYVVRRARDDDSPDGIPIDVLAGEIRALSFPPIPLPPDHAAAEIERLRARVGELEAERGEALTRLIVPSGVTFFTGPGGGAIPGVEYTFTNRMPYDIRLTISRSLEDGR